MSRQDVVPFGEVLWHVPNKWPRTNLAISTAHLMNLCVWTGRTKFQRILINLEDLILSTNPRQAVIQVISVTEDCVVAFVLNSSIGQLFPRTTASTAFTCENLIFDRKDILHDHLKRRP